MQAEAAGDRRNRRLAEWGRRRSSSSDAHYRLSHREARCLPGFYENYDAE